MILLSLFLIALCCVIIWRASDGFETASEYEGENEEGNTVDFKNDEEIQHQLLKWTEFWHKGEHDDRTLAIIY